MRTKKDSVKDKNDKPEDRYAHLKEHRFKAGNKSNPLGAKAHNKAVLAARRLTVDTYREVIELVLQGNLADLKEMAENPNTPALQVGVAVAFMKAIKTGDYNVIERIAERIVGKIPDQLNVTSNNNSTLHVGMIDQTKLKAALIALEHNV